MKAILIDGYLDSATIKKLEANGATVIVSKSGALITGISRKLFTEITGRIVNR